MLRFLFFIPNNQRYKLGETLMITKKMSRYEQKEGKKLYLCKTFRSHKESISE